MVGKESHPVRNGIIASVVGGVILSAITPLREFVLKGLKWLWSGIIWAWESLIASYSMPGWALLIIGVFAFVGVARIYFAIRPEGGSETQELLTRYVVWCKMALVMGRRQHFKSLVLLPALRCRVDI